MHLGDQAKEVTGPDILQLGSCASRERLEETRLMPEKCLFKCSRASIIFAVDPMSVLCTAFSALKLPSPRPLPVISRRFLSLQNRFNEGFNTDF